MIRVMIIKVPQGEAPEWVRQAWVGLVLPCTGTTLSSSGVLSGQLVDHGEGFRVPQQEACEILTKASPVAAKWWKDNGYPRPGRAFVFYEDEVMVLEGEHNQQAWG